MNQFYGTFGTGHSHHGYYQPILVDTLDLAGKIMFGTYGLNWASIYTEDEFKECKERGIFLDLKPLPIIEEV